MQKNQVSIESDQVTTFKLVEEIKDKKLIDEQYKRKQVIKERIKKYMSL